MSMEQQNKPAKKKGFSNFLHSKKLRYGGFSALLIAGVIALTVLINVAVTALDNNWNLKADMTANNMFKISTQTQNVMKGLTTPVKFIGLFPEGSMNEITELLNRYRALNPSMVEIQTVDITKNPTFTSKFVDSTETVAQDSIIVTSGDETRYRVVDPSSMYEYDYNYQTFQSTVKAFIGEQALTNAVVFVSSEEQSRAFFLSGHSETPLSSYQYVVPQLEQFNMLVKEIGTNELSDLRAGDILIVSSPQRDLSDDERETLKTYLENGGHMIFMRSATDAELPGFDSLLALFGVTVEHDLVVDPASSMAQSPVIVVPEMADHDITKSLTANGLFSVLPYASSFSLPTVQENSRTVSSILSSSSESYGKVDLQSEQIERQDADLPGPRTLGVAITQEHATGLTTKIAAFGNSFFITDSSVSTYSGNRDLFYNAVRWMQGESTAVSIVGKSLVGNRINIATYTQLYTLAALVVIVIPLVILGVGMFIFLKRRHL